MSGLDLNSLTGHTESTIRNRRFFELFPPATDDFQMHTEHTERELVFHTVKVSALISRMNSNLNSLTGD